MAYESMTYETILGRMIGKVVEKYPNLDIREGSIIHNALSPAAIELAIMYTELDNVLSESFVNTASREYILIACKDMGIDITAFEAKAGIHKGVFDVPVEIGSRWNCDLYNYVALEYTGLENGYYTYRMECETIGEVPNKQIGSLIAITDHPSGLKYAELTECLIEGEDETSDEDIKTAYYDYINSTIADGNVRQYKQWCNEYEGIGNSKIFPLWNGANTVKVSILSVSNQVASQELVDEFQEYLDPGITGMGDGVAPIGAFVTVSTATELPINISATVKMKDGYTDTSKISTALENYFSEIAYNKLMVSYMNVGAEILKVDGVEFISNLLINGGTKDVILGDEEIPTVGTTEWVVS
jgi:uncharacterized phage protein gp47/JayE